MRNLDWTNSFLKLSLQRYSYYYRFCYTPPAPVGSPPPARIWIDFQGIPGSWCWDRQWQTTSESFVLWNLYEVALTWLKIDSTFHHHHYWWRIGALEFYFPASSMKACVSLPHCILRPPVNEFKLRLICQTGNLDQTLTQVRLPLLCSVPSNILSHCSILNILQSIITH